VFVPKMSYFVVDQIDVTSEPTFKKNNAMVTSSNTELTDFK